MKGLTLTVITNKASSLNYGESIGNISVLKKITLGDNTQLSYVSDKALKYEIRRQGKERFGWRLLDEKLREYVERNSPKNVLDVDAFGKELVRDYEEFDLFGGLFTKISGVNKLSKGDAVKRTSVVKVSRRRGRISRMVIKFYIDNWLMAVSAVGFAKVLRENGIDAKQFFNGRVLEVPQNIWNILPELYASYLLKDFDRIVKQSYEKLLNKKEIKPKDVKNPYDQVVRSKLGGFL